MVVVVSCDASCFAAGVQCQKLDQKGQVTASERHKFTLTEAERELPHTVQENLAVAKAVGMIIRRFNLNAEPNQCQPLSAQSDNQATAVAGAKPTSTLSTSEAWRETLWEARTRRLTMQTFHLKKLLMDRTFCDHFGRVLSHGQTWGTMHAAFLAGMHMLGMQWRWELDWDLAACRVTTQARRFHSRFDEPETRGIDSLVQPWAVPGVRRLHLPESVVGKALQRLAREPQQLVVVVPLRLKTPAWWWSFPADLRETRDDAGSDRLTLPTGGVGLPGRDHRDTGPSPALPIDHGDLPLRQSLRRRLANTSDADSAVRHVLRHC